jgi:hypothetical protein
MDQVEGAFLDDSAEPMRRRSGRPPTRPAPAHHFDPMRANPQLRQTWIDGCDRRTGDLHLPPVSWQISGELRYVFRYPAVGWLEYHQDPPHRGGIVTWLWGLLDRHAKISLG